MARLDYALLCEHARVDVGGTLSVLGGSFSVLNVREVPTQVPMAVATRVVFSDQDNEPTLLVVTFHGPPAAPFAVSFESEVAPPSWPFDDIDPSVVTVVGATFPVAAEGLHRVTVRVGDGDAQELRFHASVLTQSE